MTASPDALLLVDKPAGWTSHDVVARTRRLAGTRRVGHAGTLDPMATGVLVLGLNKATKLLTYLVGCDKTYTATIRLGQATVTDDAEGEVTDSPGVQGVSLERVQHAIAGLTGAIQQIPSQVSAIKVDGQRAYARVRGGQEVALQPRAVTVSRFDVHDHAWHQVDGLQVLDLQVSVEVSSGTYVRALARDLGRAVGSAGHLTALRRTRVGVFDIADCHPLESLIEGGERGESLPALAMAQAAARQFPVRRVEPGLARDLRHGKRVPLEGPRVAPVAAIGPGEDLVALLDQSGPGVLSLVVFPSAGPASGR